MPETSGLLTSRRRTSKLRCMSLSSASVVSLAVSNTSTSDLAASKGASERPAEVAATREQPTLTPAAPDRDQPADDGKDSPADSGSAGRKVSALSGQDVVTVVPGVPRYHRSDCILIRFMGDSDLQRMSVERAQEAGCTPCRACQPDGEEEE